LRALLLQEQQTGKSEKEMARAFNYYDANQDGFLDQEEAFFLFSDSLWLTAISERKKGITNTSKILNDPESTYNQLNLIWNSLNRSKKDYMTWEEFVNYIRKGSLLLSLDFS